MGFEYLASFAANQGFDIVSDQDSHHVELTLDWLQDPLTTKMFEDAEEYVSDFQTIPFAFQSHSHGLSTQAFKLDRGLAAMFTPTSTSTDPNSGDTFVSTMEAKDYPFFATQFHPEKVLEQWSDTTGLEHNWSSYELNKYFGQEFIKLARQNSNNPGTYEEV